ncbi:MAG: DUF3306 domain-containing protein [Rhodobacteraceae bacterium]|nr:DUF3306 domain-containing protein [Paracoccaceae bacterium]MCY4139353.1 DUF3306 domain-containing protein [Paracoccaceae bacterium]
MKQQETTDFWSRRKAAVARENAQEAERARQTAAGSETETRDQAFDDRSEAEVLQQLDLPDPDSLGPGDDFSAFMKAAVPESIRRRALRKLWLSNPVLANLDELVDYGEDFTDAATVVDNLQTAYKVGKGMLRHVTADDEAVAEPEPDSLAEEATGNEPERNIAENVEAAPEMETQELQPVGRTNGHDSPIGQPEPEAEDVSSGRNAPAGPRRMRFRITA